MLDAPLNNIWIWITNNAGLFLIALISMCIILQQRIIDPSDSFHDKIYDISTTLLGINQNITHKMKLLGRNFEKDGGGRLTLVPEDSEDIWHIYNLIQVGDILRGPTVRKVTTESSTGSTASTRVHTTLTIQVIDIIYDPSEEGIHCKGQNVEENPHVKMGAHHTLDLQPQRKISITKPCWDAIHLDRIELACNPGARADVAAVVMQEGIVEKWQTATDVMSCFILCVKFSLKCSPVKESVSPVSVLNKDRVLQSALLSRHRTLLPSNLTTGYGPRLADYYADL